MQKVSDYVHMGIPGMDELFHENGVPRNSTLLVTGAPGTGKSILAWQFLYNGALKYKEPGLLVTIEESAEEVRANALRVGLDFASLEKKGLITIIEKPLLTKSIFGAGELSERIRRHKVKRVVLDSLTLFEYIYPQGTVEYRNELLRFLRQMAQENITLICTAEHRSEDLDEFTYRPHDFLFSGLFILGKVRQGSTYERVMHVAKLRGEAHNLNIVPIKIQKGGMHLYPGETPFALTARDFRKKS